jgi:diamine N-acetyltransferase
VIRLEDLFVNIVIMLEIREGKYADGVLIHELAEAIWWPTYGAIIDDKQIRFMLDLNYNIPSLDAQILHKDQTYLLLFDNGKAIGFTSFAPREEDPEIFKLHKLYCLPEKQSKGLGKALLHAVENEVVKAGKSRLELNVNRQNPAVGFYQKMGFEILYEEDIPIGSFWMNDFVMGKALNRSEYS